MTDPESTPIDNLYKQRQIKKRLVCIKLNDLTEDVGGELMIGGCDVEADFWVPNGEQGFLEVNLTKVEAVTKNGEVIATFCGPKRPCTAVLDTGANILGIDR